MYPSKSKARMGNKYYKTRASTRGYTQSTQVVLRHFIKKKKKEEEEIVLQHIYIRASPSQNSIIFYFTIFKNYFINYTIQFYNIPNISTFILQYYTLK